MQKQQLDQIQLQQQANSTATANSTHVSTDCSENPAWLFLSSGTKLLSPPPLRQGLPHTLDQASAQFAASALVTADQLLALKAKEELGPGGGVNGVLSPSGMTTLQTVDGRRGLKNILSPHVARRSNSLCDNFSIKWSLVFRIDCSVCL